jgi:hypothetical protein
MRGYLERYPEGPWAFFGLDSVVHGKHPAKQEREARLDFIDDKTKRRASQDTL